jgi:hypothetical protein
MRTMKVTIAQDTDKQELRDEYENAVAALTQIKNASSLTQAQAVQAVQYMAKVLLFLIKLLARTLIL